MFLLDHHRQPSFHHGVILVRVLIASSHFIEEFRRRLCVCVQDCVLCSSQFVCVRACVLCVFVAVLVCVCVCVSVQYYRIVIVVRFPNWRGNCCCSVLSLWARTLMNGFLTRVVRGGISLSLSLSLARGRFFVFVVTTELCITINALLR
jgi:hypothetical protein